MTHSQSIAFFGSSLVSAYWNGAATYYRGIIRALFKLGHRVTFFEPDAFERQKHRDMDDPPWARVVVYPATEQGVFRALGQAAASDVIIKASGVGVFDQLLERAVLSGKGQRDQTVVFWDVDAPATLARVHGDASDPFRELIPQYDFVLTYGGGPRVVSEYEGLGARQCVPIYNAVDPAEHHSAAPSPQFEGDLNFLGNRLPDREARVEEFFFEAARRLPNRRFVLGGNGWDQNAPSLANVHYAGHVYSRDHNSFNCTPLAVLNINRQSMADYGYSPATRIFEAAGAGACLISDSWLGIEEFLEPGREVLLADSGEDVAMQLGSLTPSKARSIGRAARRRVLAEHTYQHRARQLELVLGSGATAAR